MALKSKYAKERTEAGDLILHDCGGPLNRSVTNDAENIIPDLVRRGHLIEGQRCFYFDSEGDFAELVWADGAFVKYAAADIPEGFEREPDRELAERTGRAARKGKHGY
jgi:hypothetical protein